MATLRNEVTTVTNQLTRIREVLFKVEDESGAAQSRAIGKAEYEIYGNDSARTHYDCANRADACACIRKMVARGISIDAVYQRVGQRLVKLAMDDQARIVIEAMEA